MPHTPGPWEYVTAQKGYPYEPTRKDFLRFVGDCWDDSDGEGWGGVRSDSAGAIICIFGNGPTTEPNARLIAAAPDMLAVLKKIDECYTFQLPDLTIEVKAAIKKAEGVEG